MRTISAAILAGLFIAQLTFAFPARADVAADAARITSACYTGGGFGYRFGALETLSDRLHDAPRSDGRFVARGAQYTEFEHVLWAASADLEIPDDETADAVIAEAGRRLLALGFRLDPDGHEYGFGQDVYGSGGFRIGMSPTYRGVAISCSDDILQSRNSAEILGGIALVNRPHLPTFNALPPVSPGICATEEGRAVYNRSFILDTDRVTEFMKLSWGYAKRLALWKGRQLRGKGVWTAVQEADFRRQTFRELAMEEHEGVTALGLVLLAEQFSFYRQAADRGDAVTQCDIATSIDRTIGAISARLEATGDYIDARYDAEAKQLDVD